MSTMIYSWNADSEGYVTGFIPLVKFVTELGDFPGGVTIYRSANECQFYHPEVEKHGIVEVKVKFSKLIAGIDNAEQLQVNLRQYRRSWTKHDINTDYEADENP